MSAQGTDVEFVCPEHSCAGQKRLPLLLTIIVFEFNIDT